MSPVPKKKLPEINDKKTENPRQSTTGKTSLSESLFKYPQTVNVQSEVRMHVKSEYRSVAPPIGIAKQVAVQSSLQEQLSSMDVPTEELRMNMQSVTDMEKYFHSEFFKGRPTKTPERYVKIRAFILNAWLELKPSYVSKTTVRNGLKHCGDVNCISRIHSLLEQIGAINFGHGGDHFLYVRPLANLKETFSQPSRNKQIANATSAEAAAMMVERRQRIKSNTYGNMPNVDANYTVSHIDGTSMLIFPNCKSDDTDDEEVDSRVRQRLQHVKPEYQLIRCLRFHKDKIAPFKVSITLSTLLCLQLHSLSSKHEVMGFLGGYQTKSLGRKKLSLTRYKPCQTSEQSDTMCEMCPGKLNTIYNTLF